MSGYVLISLISSVLFIILIIINKIYDKDFIKMLVIPIISIVMSFSLTVSLIRPVTVKRELKEIEENQISINYIYSSSNSNNAENIALNNSILILNTKIARIKADQEILGIFSWYYGFDINKLNYLKIQ